ILMLTAKDREYDEAETLDTGADNFLSKPFSFVVLVAHLRTLTHHRSDHNLTPLELDDLVLDVTARTYRRDNTPIQLSPREFALLETLLHNRNKMVSKQELLEQI